MKGFIMIKKDSAGASLAARDGFLSRAAKHFRREWQLHLLMLLPLIQLIIFHYYPMYGAQIAFRKYSAVKGIWGSEWAGAAQFRKFFSNYMFRQVLWNSLRLSLYSLIAGFPIPIMLALQINACPSDRFKKLVQMVTYAPYFISIIVLIAILNQFLSNTVGIYANIARMFGAKDIPSILASVNSFDHIYVWSGVWQSAGYNAIIYIAALSAIDPTLYEAASIDGASRFQKVWHIDIPGILPTAAILLILNSGSLLNVGFEKIYLMQNSVNNSVSEVISTYVYKQGIGAGFPDYSYSTAVGLFNSVISFVLIVLTNTVSKKLGGSSMW